MLTRTIQFRLKLSLLSFLKMASTSVLILIELYYFVMAFVDNKFIVHYMTPLIRIDIGFVLQSLRENTRTAFEFVVICFLDSGRVVFDHHVSLQDPLSHSLRNFVSILKLTRRRPFLLITLFFFVNFLVYQN